MEAFHHGASASDILKSCQLSLGVAAAGLQVRSTLLPTDDIGGRAFFVLFPNGEQGVILAPGEDMGLLGEIL